MRAASIALCLLLIFTAAGFAGDFGKFTKEEVCIAGIALNNGRKVKDLTVKAEKSGTVTVSYVRKEDGKKFSYSCKIEGDQIRWMEPGMTRWNKNIKLFYKIIDGGNALEITADVLGEKEKKTFKLEAFKSGDR